MSRFLNELDAKNLLASYGLPMAKSAVGHCAQEARRLAMEMGFPVVMKVLSPDILHKTDAGCVVLGVREPREAEEAYSRILDNARAYDPGAKVDGVLIQEMAPAGLEIILGVKKDPQFGPVVMVGTGGIYVEVFKDIALRLLPITRLDAVEMLEETKLCEMVRGARGRTCDEEALIRALLCLSDAVSSNPEIEEIDINPFFLYEKGARGVDALIKLER